VQLDVDMYPDPALLKSYARFAPIISQVVLIGPRKYVDLNSRDETELLRNPLLIRDTPEVITNNNVANRTEGGRSVDWRLKAILRTNYLKSEPLPFRLFAAGNVAFSRRRFLEVGGYDERFVTWGHEDGELGFRFYNNGL